MLARDWYYNERRQIGLDSAVASICELHDDRDVRARAALTMLGVQRGWRIADIGCGNGVLACEAAMMGAEVDAIDISPAMLALAEIYARDRKAPVRTQSAGLLSFAYRPESYDLIVSEFTLHHLPDFWKAVAMSRIYRALKPGATFYLRDIVFVRTPDGADRDVEEWADFSITNHDFDRDSVVTHMRDEYSTFGWVIEQIKHQLDRMIPVYRVVDMTLTGRSIERELAMVKVRGTGDHRVEALRLAEAFRARVIDATTESFVFEITGNSAKINQFIDLMRPLGLVEVSRTGVAAIGRGPEGM